MSAFLPLMALSFSGLLMSAYLIWERVNHRRPVCLMGDSCHVVLESRYNHLLGVHNDLAGLMFYFGVLLILLALRFNVGPVDFILMTLEFMTAFAALMSVVFTLIQWRILKAWCFWCTISNINTLVIALAVFQLI